MSQVSIWQPGFESLSLHVALNLSKDSLPVLLGSLLTVDEKTYGIICLSHALVLECSSHVLSTIYISVMLQWLSVESDVSREGIIQESHSQLLDHKGSLLFLRISEVASSFPFFHSKHLSLEEQFSESLIDESSLKWSNLIFSPLNILFILKSIFVPNHILLLDIVDNFASFLHNSKIVLISPS